MSIPKEPRQQMINMMYLVLTALLALNVSAEILKAFALVNQSLEKTTNTIIDKNDAMYKQFDKKMSEDPGKTKPQYEKAKLVKQYCDEMYKYLGEIKIKIIDEATIGKLPTQITLLTKILIAMILAVLIGTTLEMSIDDTRYRRAKKQSAQVSNILRKKVGGE